MSDEFDNPFAEHDIRKSGLAHITPLEKILFALVASPFWLACSWLLVFSVPRTAKVFADFRMKVPHGTEFVLAWGWLTVPILLLVACTVGLILQRRWAVYLSFVVLPAILSTLVFVSIYFPLRALIEGLGGNNIDMWTLIWG